MQWTEIDLRLKKKYLCTFLPTTEPWANRLEHNSRSSSIMTTTTKTTMLKPIPQTQEVTSKGRMVRKQKRNITFRNKSNIGKIEAPRHCNIQSQK